MTNTNTKIKEKKTMKKYTCTHIWTKYYKATNEKMVIYLRADEAEHEIEKLKNNPNPTITIKKLEKPVEKYFAS